MSDTLRPDEESQLIDLLIEHDRQLVDGATCELDRRAAPGPSGLHRIRLNKAKQCLEQLRNFAKRRAFPTDMPENGNVGGGQQAYSPVAHVTPNDDHSRRSTVGRSAGPEGMERAKRDFPPTRIPESIGRFKILSQLGVGGFGIVFHAHDPKLNRDVALKILRPESLLTSANRIRFERESQLAAMLSHPAIVPVFETGTDGPIRFIVFGYVPGETLAGWFARFGGPLDSRHACDLMIRIADAVACAHGRGILHRDLKPGNLLVQAEHRNEIVAPEVLANRTHVADFGLAINLEHTSSLTCSGSMVGTPVYIAPELISGIDKPSTASDVYSLGVILYELLAGRPPFQSDSGLHLLRSIVEDEPPRINAIRSLAASKSMGRFGVSQVSRDLEAICFKSLHKNPSARYQSASELHQDLLRWRSGETVTARRVTTLSQIGRWAGRKPVIASLLATVLTMALALALGGTWASIELARRNSNLRDSYYRSLVSSAQLIRQAEFAGRRTDSLAAISSAVELWPGGRLDPQRALLLRNEAIASLNIVDTQIVAEIPLPGPQLSRHAFEIAFDSTLRHVACPNADGDIVILDTASGDSVILIPTAGHLVRQLSFLPGDQQLCGVLGTSEFAEMLVWNLSANHNETRIELTVKNVNPDFRIDFAGGGQSIIWLDDLNRVREIKLEDGENQARTIAEYADRAPAGAACSPAGDKLAIWLGNRVDVWPLSDNCTAAEPEMCFEHDFNPGLEINSARWSPDDESLATTTSVFTTHLWSTVWRESQHQEFGGHTSWVYHAVFDPTGNFMATSSSDNTTRTWNCETGDLLMVNQGQVMATDAGGKRLAGVNQDSIVVWQRVDPEFQVAWTIDGRPLEADGGQSNPDGRYLVFSNANQTTIREIETQRNLWNHESECVTDVAFSGDGNYGFAAAANSILRIDLSSGEAVNLLAAGDSGFGCGTMPSSMSANHDGSMVAVAQEGVRMLFDCRTGLVHEASFQALECGHIRFHPAEPWFAVATGSGIEFWNYESNTRVMSLLGSEYSFPIRFDPASRYLVFHDNGRPAIVDLDSQTINLISELPTQLGRDDIAFSPDGRWLAVTGISDAIILYRLTSRATAIISEVARFPVSTSRTWVAFSSGSDQLISGDANQRLYHWSLSEVRQALAGLQLDWD